MSVSKHVCVKGRNQVQTEQETQQELTKEEVASWIADQLGETEFGPRSHIFQIVKAAGRTHAKELLAKTLETEANGGILVPDGSRRRTPGGVFFHLAYTIGKTKAGYPLKRPQNYHQKPQKNPSGQDSKQTQIQQQAPTNAHAIAFAWEDRITAIKEIATEKGSATTVKITLVGRPGKVLDKGQFILTMMESTKLPALPKGLPTPKDTATKYAVYISQKQWKKVSEVIQDHEDVLIVEGFPKLDQEAGSIAVFASNVTTKKQQMAKKQQQQQQESAAAAATAE
jgi:hypothetical protein